MLLSSRVGPAHSGGAGAAPSQPEVQAPPPPAASSSGIARGRGRTTGVKSEREEKRLGSARAEAGRRERSDRAEPKSSNQPAPAQPRGQPSAAPDLASARSRGGERARAATAEQVSSLCLFDCAAAVSLCPCVVCFLFCFSDHAFCSHTTARPQDGVRGPDPDPDPDQACAL